MTWLPPLDETLRDAYLCRLGLAGVPAPSVETLFAVHRAQAERIPYETVWLWLGEPRTIAPLDCVRFLLAGRGGYCYHLNGALATLLGWLGFDVHRHVGGVQVNAAEPAGATANHMALTVHGLPAEGNPGGAWFVDTGLGDGLHEPMPLAAGEHRQGPFRYALSASAAVEGGWRFHADPRMSLLGMDFAAGDAPPGAFDAKHAWLQTAPESGFVRVLAIARRDARGVDLLRGRILHRVGDAATSTELPTSTAWYAALADVFALPLSDVDRSRREALWTKVTTAHDAWLAAQAREPAAQ
jgi:arylamine N-acetyltransferase